MMTYSLALSLKVPLPSVSSVVSICWGAIGVVADDGVVGTLRRTVVRPDVDVEAELGVGIGGAHNLLLYLKLAVLVLRRHRGNGGQGELHVAGGAGQTALSVIELKRVLARVALRDVVPTGSHMRRWSCARRNVTNKPAIEEYPHIVIAEEVVLQRANIIFSQLELDAVLHAEHVVVG